MYYPSAPAMGSYMNYEYLIVMRAWPTEHWKLWKLLSNLDVTVQLRVTTPQTQSIPWTLNQKGRPIFVGGTIKRKHFLTFEKNPKKYQNGEQAAVAHFPRYYKI